MILFILFPAYPALSGETPPTFVPIGVITKVLAMYLIATILALAGLFRNTGPVLIAGAYGYEHRPGYV
jgi:hypothetical protein